MNLNEFMKKYAKCTEEFLTEDGSKKQGFNVKDFPEALQKFTDGICAKQRQSCYEHAKKLKEDNCFLASEMLFTPQPEI